MTIAIHFEGHPYDDDYDTSYGYTRDLATMEEAKQEAFESLSPEYAVTIYAEDADPDDLTVLSEWHPAKGIWVDQEKNIQKAFCRGNQMSEYKLKDNELQERLEGIWPGFGAKLREAAQCGNYYGGIAVNLAQDMRIAFGWSALELIRTYNPTGWNEFPGVKPPVGAVMQVAYRTASGDLYGEVAFFGEDDKWHLTDLQKQTAPRDFLTDAEVLRFRSWY